MSRSKIDIKSLIDGSVITLDEDVKQFTKQDMKRKLRTIESSTVKRDTTIEMPEESVTKKRITKQDSTTMKRDIALVTPDKPCLLLPIGEKRFQCQSCDQSFSTRFSLKRHGKKSHHVQRRLFDDLSVEEVEKTEVAAQAKRRRRRDFISEKEFNQLALRQPIPWSNLSRDCIYQLEWVNRADHQIVVNMTNVDGIIVSVLLPQFVVDKLLTFTENNVRIYVRPTGQNQVDIAAAKKYICNNCEKELASRKYLQLHEKRCNAQAQ